MFVYQEFATSMLPLKTIKSANKLFLLILLAVIVRSEETVHRTMLFSLLLGDDSSRVKTTLWNCKQLFIS